MLFELVNSYGEETAIYLTKEFEKAISDIEQSCLTFDFDPEFVRRDSLYYASDQAGSEKIVKDYYYLSKHQFNVDLLNPDQIYERYAFRKENALYIYNDAELNPLKYNYGLLLKAQKRGFEFMNTRKSLAKIYMTIHLSCIPKPDIRFGPAM